MNAITKVLLKIGEKAPATVGAATDAAATSPWWYCASLVALPALMLLQEFLESRGQKKSAEEVRARLDELLARQRRGDADQANTAEFVGRLLNGLPTDDLPEEGPFQTFARLFHQFLRGEFDAIRDNQNALDAAVESLSAEQRQRWATLFYQEFPALRDRLGLVGADLKELLDDYQRLRREINTQHQEVLRKLDDQAIVPPLEFTLRVPDGAMRFTYRGQRTDLFGREAEMAALRAFLEPSAERHVDFQWWLWTGPGGAGKSRLAWELCLEAGLNGWHVGFLDTTANFHDWHRWRITRPTLVVVDYVARRAEAARQALVGLGGHPEQIERPLRILLLERPIDSRLDPWWSAFSSRESRTTFDTLRQFAHGVRDSDDLSRANRPLTALSDDALATIIERIIEETPGAALPDRARVLETLRQIDPEGRPLFAMLAAETIQEKGIESIHQWDAETLAGHILDRELGGWRRECDVGNGPSEEMERHLNLLAFVTIIGSQPYDVTERLKARGVDVPPQRADIQLGWWRRFLGYSTEEADDTSRLAPLTPDILGELFVLQRLAGALHTAKNPRVGPPDETRKLLKIAWSHFPYETAIFFLRAARDLPSHQHIQELEPPKNGDGSPPPGGDWPQPTDKARSLSWLLIGVAYGEHLGRREEALDAFDTAIRHAPDDAQAHSNRGVVLEQLGRREEALDAYDTAIRLAPDDAKAHSNRGNVLGQLGRREEALDAFNTAIRHAPDDAQAHSNRGVVLGKLGRREEALDAYDTAIRLAPDDAQAHYNRGVVLGQLGRREEALDAYDTAIRLAPDDAQAHYNRGVVLEQLGRREEALDAYDTAIRLAPDDAQAHLGRGLVLGQMGEVEQAKEALRRVIALEPPGSPLAQFAQDLLNKLP